MDDLVDDEAQQPLGEIRIEMGLLGKGAQARDLVLAYFHDGKDELVRRFFADDPDAVAHATSREA